MRRNIIRFFPDDYGAARTSSGIKRYPVTVAIKNALCRFVPEIAFADHHGSAARGEDNIKILLQSSVAVRSLHDCRKKICLACHSSHHTKGVCCHEQGHCHKKKDSAASRAVRVTGPACGLSRAACH